MFEGLIHRSRIGLAFTLVWLLVAAVTTAAPASTGYVGSGSCQTCHAEFYKLWAPSHHGLAMQPYTAELARTGLTPQREALKVGGLSYRAAIGKNEGWVQERGPGGEKRHSIAQVLGGKNVYYFLTTLERGRLQTLPVAYDVRKKEWFDTAESAVRHFAERPDQALDWKDPAYTFNTSCHGCHVSQLATNYDAATDSYHTTWAEPGINCETCHGPAAEHIKAAQTAAGKPLADAKIIRIKPMSTEQKNDLCAPCHAKMTPIGTDFTPGGKYFEHYDLVTLEDADFYPDGRDLGENYTFTQWRLNPCTKAGKLDCLHCHTSSGRYRFDDPAHANDACLPCHQERVAKAAEHTHHQAGKPGARCIDCHMPQTEFARMRRTDHSLRPPLPAATRAFKSPNACNLCHKDKDAEWSDKQVREWSRKDYQAATLRWAGLVEAARKSDWTRLPEMLDYLASAGREEVAASALARLLRACPDPRKTPALIGLLHDKSPLVRAAAADSLGEGLTTEAVAKLIESARDAVRLVRIRAGSALAGVPPQMLDEAGKVAAARAQEEFLAAMRARPDDAISHYNLGNYYLARQETTGAIAEFEASLRLRPEGIMTLVNASLAYSAAGQNDKAEASLRRALKADPASAAASLNLGLLLGEMGRMTEAEAAFRAVLKTDPRNAVAAYNLGVLVSKDRLDEAVRWCRTAFERQPDDPKYGYTLAFFLRKGGDSAGAAEILTKTLELSPAHGDSILLLGMILEGQGKGGEAQKLYLRAMQDSRIDEATRRRIMQKMGRE